MLNTLQDILAFVIYVVITLVLLPSFALIWLVGLPIIGFNLEDTSDYWVSILTWEFMEYAV